MYGFDLSWSQCFALYIGETSLIVVELRSIFNVFNLVSSLRPPKHFASFRGFSVFISVFSFSKIPFPFLLVPIGEFR